MISRKKKHSVPFVKKENKDCVISGFRVEKSLSLLFDARIKKLQAKNPSLKQSDYLHHLLMSDLKKTDNIDVLKKNEIVDEIRFLSFQLNKIGNNFNQIAHGINVAKKKHSSKFSSDEKSKFFQWFEVFKINSERFSIITKRLQSSRFF